MILTSPDFDGDNNPPNDDIHNTEPEFIVVGSELSSVEYVLVMDTSMSMFTEPDVTNPGSRINSMVDAAKRWIKFDRTNPDLLALTETGRADSWRTFVDSWRTFSPRPEPQPSS